MAIVHIYKNKKWVFEDEEFKTNNAILDNVPYNPKILFIGTFNPQQDGNNPEFFYGRNYFWPAFFNLFEYKRYELTKRRDTFKPFNPSLNEILSFCKKYELVFADLISEILHKDQPLCSKIISSKRGKPIQQILYKGKVYNAIRDSKKKDKKTKLITYGLDDLANEDQVLWTTRFIKEYIKRTSSICTVYITRNPSNPFKEQWKELKNFGYGRNVKFRRIFTPSGQGSGAGIGKMNYIIRHWLGKYDFKDKYEGLDMKWLREYLSESLIHKFIS